MVQAAARRGFARRCPTGIDRASYVRTVTAASMMNPLLRLPARRSELNSVVAHLGPTNSGKTHAALTPLIERSEGIYATPLRMLAWEGYERLCAELGADKVGLVTGEERINPAAPVIATTAEMAPARGPQRPLLVLDEVHWAADPTRGWAWTRLLLAGEFQQLRLIGALDALPLLRSAFDTIKVIEHERLGELRWIGSRDVAGLEPSTAVVAFSRRQVLSLAKALSARYGAGRVAVLYGSMPAQTRREQLRRVRAGEADLVVCTDVIGHGLNLPIATVLFAETAKFDGRRLRQLHSWEAAQIAGRAGRFGLHESGDVGVLSGVKRLTPDPKTVRSGLRPRLQAPGGSLVHRLVQHARLRPELEDLDVDDASQLGAAITDWHAEHRVALRDHPYLAAETPDAMLARLALSWGSLSQTERGQLDTSAAWTLLRAPVDPADAEAQALLGMLAKAAAGGDVDLGSLLRFPEQVTLEALEALARHAASLRWFAGVFPQATAPSRDRAASVESRAASAATALLDATLSHAAA